MKSASEEEERRREVNRATERARQPKVAAQRNEYRNRM